MINIDLAHNMLTAMGRCESISTGGMGSVPCGQHPACNHNCQARACVRKFHDRRAAHRVLSPYPRLLFAVPIAVRCVVNQYLKRSLCGTLFFCYILVMQIEINSRGNGACPVCNSSGNCRIQDMLTNSMAAFSQSNDPMELVVYSCPLFQERP